MTDIKIAIIQHLSALIGAELSACHRAADMMMLQFGTLSAVTSRTGATRKVGRWSLHVQCPWRIEVDSTLFTGRSDLWEPEEIPVKGFDWSEWDFEAGNLRDKKLAMLFGTSQDRRGASRDGDPRVVTSVEADAFGGARISMSAGCDLVLFPDGTRNEDWRLLTEGDTPAHFVISGGQWASH